MLNDIFYRFAGLDRQILGGMADFPAERHSLAAGGAYLMLLALVTGISFFYLASVMLDAQASTGSGRVWALLEECLSSGLACLLVWNSYRLMLLTNFPHVDEATDPLRDVARASAKIVIAALYGAVVAVPLALALSDTWHGPSLANSPAPAWSGLLAGQAPNPPQQALLDAYLERQKLLRSTTAAVGASGDGAASMQTPDELRPQLAQIAQKIRAGHLALQTEHVDGQGGRTPGFVTRLEALARHYPVFLVLSMFFSGVLFSMPVVAYAMRRKGVYEYLQAMQAIRCVAAEGVVPRAVAIRGQRRNTEYVRHRFLRAETLARLQRKRFAAAVHHREGA